MHLHSILRNNPNITRLSVDIENPLFDFSLLSPNLTSLSINMGVDLTEFPLLEEVNVNIDKSIGFESLKYLRKVTIGYPEDMKYIEHAFRRGSYRNR